MPKAVCPSCGAMRRFADAEAGKHRPCQNCDHDFAMVAAQTHTVSVSELPTVNRYQQLLAGDLPSEQFVRQALQILESDFREVALLALADWAQLEIVVPEMFHAVASLQRPSWGSWNGLLSALRNARKAVLRDANVEARSKVERAKLLKGLLELLNMQFDAELAATLKPLSELTGASVPKKPKLGFVLTIPITLRNRVAHDAPTSDEWWDEAAAALRPLIDFHTIMHPLHLLSEDDFQLPSPWFLVQDDKVWAFNGLAREMEVIYVSQEGESEFSEQRSRELLLELQMLLGKTESQETDFRKLLTTLAPEDIKGVMMGDYLVGKPIGSGGFATVHVGRQLSTGRKVAIKILHDGMSDDIQQRFQQEARFLSRLEHPNIVGVFGYGEETWSAPRAFSLSEEEWFQQFSKSAPIKSYIAMEWVDGKTLDEIFGDEAESRPSQKKLADWFAQAAASLVAVHSTGMIHRDIKPANLMVNEDNEVKLMDFGIARAQSDQRTLMTEAGRTFGTPAYMPPEQIRAADLEAEVGPTSDVYSLCATFYELFTRRRLYDHDSESMETVKTHKLSGVRPPRPRLHTKGLPWELEAIVMGGLEADLADRYKSMEALKKDIDHFLADEPIEYSRPGVLRRLRLTYRRNRAVCNLAAVFAVLMAGGIAAYIVAVTNAAIENRRLFEKERDTVKKLNLAMDGVKRQNVEHIKALEQTKQEMEALAAQLPEIVAVQNVLAGSKESIAISHRVAGRLAEAKSAFDEAIETRKLVVEKSHDESPEKRAEYKHLLAKSHYNLALVLDDMGQFGDAKLQFEAAIALHSDLVESAEDGVEFRKGLARDRDRLGDLYFTAGQNLDDVQTEYQAAQAIWQSLQEGNENDAECQFGLAQSDNNKGVVYVRLNQAEDAVAAHTQAIAVCSALVGRFKDDAEQGSKLVEYMNELATSQLNLAAAYRTLDRDEDAKTAFEQAVAGYRELASTYIESAHVYRRQLAVALKQLAVHFIAQEDEEAATNLLQEARTIFEELVQDEASLPTDQLNLAEVAVLQRLPNEDDIALATAGAEECVKRTEQDNETLFRAARIAAQVGDHLLKDESLPQEERKTLAEQSTAQAIRWLEKVRKSGFFDEPANVQRLGEDPQLKVLESNAEFQKMSSELSSRG